MKKQEQNRKFSILNSQFSISRDARGFTLVELLVVIVIIGILAGIIIASLSGARKVARDRRRVADLQLVSGALQAYIKDGNSLPQPADYQEATGGTDADGNPCFNFFDCSYKGGPPNPNKAKFVDFLQAPPDGRCQEPLSGYIKDESSCPYLDQDPLDPLDSGSLGTTYYYIYFRHHGFFVVDYGCKAPFYALIAKLETDGLNQAKNDQSCFDSTFPVPNNDQTYFIVDR